MSYTALPCPGGSGLCTSWIKEEDTDVRESGSCQLSHSLTTAVNNIRWQDMYAMDDCRDQANFFYNHMNCVINETVPTLSCPPQIDRGLLHTSNH